MISCNASQLRAFQLTTSRRGRQALPFLCAGGKGISTHDLTKRSTPTKYPVPQRLCISTHDLTKRSTFFNHLHHTTASNFNSRPHEEVDILTKNDNARMRISTHDLTKRSTLFRLCSGFLLGYFNSRPHEEVDHLHNIIISRSIEFQLTTSRRGRRNHL